MRAIGRIGFVDYVSITSIAADRPFVMRTNVALIQAAREKLAQAIEQHKSARRVARDRENELINIEQAIRAARPSSSTESLADLMQRRPAVEALLAAERRAERDAEAKVSRARQDLSSLEQRVREIRELMNSEREVESHRAFRSQLDEIDREIKQAQARRQRVELQAQQYKAGVQNLRTELAQITGEELFLSAAL